MKKTIVLYFTGFLNLMTAAAVFAQSFSMAMPIECDYGVNCYIQNYVDINSSVAYKDYKCGFLTYNDHKGTDFRLIDYKELTRGINVLAVADGTVKAIRNDQDDFKFVKGGHEAVQNKECGNGVVVIHADGYSTQYCHMLKGSIKVQEGQKIVTGQRLGFTGMSGETEFPHLHITVRKDNKVVDPFTGTEPSNSYECSLNQQLSPLWNEETQTKLKYIETALLNFYVTDKVPNQMAARAGEFREDTINRSSTNLIFWVDLMGVLEGDKIHFELINDKRQVLFSTIQNVPKKYVLYFSYAGKKIKETTKILPGDYEARIKLIRNNSEFLNRSKSIKVI